MSRRSWELLHSLWIILTFTYFTNWLAFIYVGLRTRNRRWSLYGVIYLLPFIISQFVVGLYDNSAVTVGKEVIISNPVTDVMGYIFMIAWLISIVHAFYIRKEYLLRLESVEQIHNAEDIYFQRRLKEREDAKERELRQNINRDYNMDYYESRWPKTSDNAHNDQNVTVDKTFKEPAHLLVDINHDPAEVIAELPGVGIILAKKAVKLRQDSQFESIEEFGEALGLKPHILEQIRPSVVISDLETKIQRSGRLVDI